MATIACSSSAAFKSPISFSDALSCSSVCMGSRASSPPLLGAIRVGRQCVCYLWHGQRMEEEMDGGRHLAFFSPPAYAAKKPLKCPRLYRGDLRAVPRLDANSISASPSKD